MTNLFEGGEVEPVTLDETKKYVEELVGENKKFKDVEALARGKYLSDNYIKQLETRLDEMRSDYVKLHDEYKAGPKLQELIDQMKQQQSSSDHLNANDVQNVKPIDLNEIKSLVSSTVQDLRASERENSNYELVKNKLIERFGSNYQSKFKAETENLGMSEDEVNTLARKNPQVLLRAFGLNTPVNKDNFQAPPQSTERKDSFSPTAGHKRTWAYYQEMRKNNPKLYYEPKTMLQLTKDAEELGPAFQDGNWDELGNRTKY